MCVYVMYVCLLRDYLLKVVSQSVTGETLCQLQLAIETPFTDLKGDESCHIEASREGEREGVYFYEF